MKTQEIEKIKECIHNYSVLVSQLTRMLKYDVEEVLNRENIPSEMEMKVQGRMYQMFVDLVCKEQRNKESKSNINESGLTHQEIYCRLAEISRDIQEKQRQPKRAEFVGYIVVKGERINEWRCPNKDCGFGVAEDWTYCPYCGQRVEFSDTQIQNVGCLEVKNMNS